MSVEEEGFDMSLLDPRRDVSPEPEPVADESVDEVELPDEPDEAPQSDPKPDKSAEMWDKRMQKFDQLMATHERNMALVKEQPTEKNVAAAEKSQSKLQKYLSEEDVDPYRAPREIAEEVMADRTRVEKLLQDAEARDRWYAEQFGSLSAQNAALRFAVDYPNLKDRYSEFSDKAHEAMREEYGSDINQMPDSVYYKLADKEFRRLVKEASGDSAASPKRAEIVDSAKKPKAANIIKNKSGNSVKPPETPEARAESLIAKMGQEFFGR